MISTMSALQKSIIKNKLPPRCPRTSDISKLAPYNSGRRKDYTPVSWKQYFEKYEDVGTDAGTFRVYLSPEPDHPDRPRIVTLHGGGYSGLSWALFTEEITNMIHCQVVSMDVRGHGETKVKDPDDLSAETLVNDVEQVLHKLFHNELPPLILLGHSMGGAIAVRAAHLPSMEHCLQGIAVIDVVEGTAMDALASMQGFLRGRPTHFKSIEHAIEWCVRSGQVRNVDSAKVSMPSQIVNCETDSLAINEVENYVSQAESAPLPSRRAPPPDRIEEEGDEDEDHPPQEFVKPTAVGDHGPDMNVRSGQVRNVDSAKVSMPSQIVNCETDSLAINEVENYVSQAESAPLPSRRAPPPDRIEKEGDEDEDHPPQEFVKPTAVGDHGPDMKYKWRIDLSKTERHWSGWFKGLSVSFLSVSAPRMLLLASIDGLDRELTVGQMQGKFQMQVLARCGHAVHEDTPGEVARVIATFALRHRLTTVTENGELMNLQSGLPGC